METSRPGRKFLWPMERCSMIILSTYGSGALDFTRQDGLDAIPFVLIFLVLVTLMGCWIDGRNGNNENHIQR